ncbi:hypothetical protein BZG36_05050 [Bifiguratus adelaidae]|uniref:Major facilitator superfamily (MFS) profile domain-containing protein n=1 Tax=Bifiguratus adelaidae TaxID=1938954 RepID=A0A261XYR2_9FUNG|nr:hypothetical protein BZG36_05050 [Bifiguratus adelaidae]
MSSKSVEAIQYSDNTVIEKSTPDTMSNEATQNQGSARPTESIPTEPIELVQEAYSIFTPTQKRMIVCLVSLAGVFSPLSANIYFPALNAVQADLGVTAEMVNLTIFSYLIFQAVSPSMWGSLADVWGRRPIYICCFVIYIGACVGLALVPNYGGLLILRMVQAFGGSSVIAIGSGTIGDIATRNERGGYMGLFGLGPTFGPILGPVIGGALAQTLGWRSIFWLLAIASFVVLIPMVLFLPETLRSLIGNGSGYANPTLSQFYKKHHQPEKWALAHSTATTSTGPKNRSRSYPNPLKSLLLLFEKDVALVVFYLALVYAVFYAMQSSVSLLFATIYGLNDLEIGLTFIASGVGCMVGTFATGKIMDRDYRVILRPLEANAPEVKDRGKLDPSFPIEAARMRSTWICMIILYICVILYGWMLEMRVHLAVPLVLQAIMGYCTTAIFNAISTLLVDLFPGSSASVSATNNLARCTLGAVATVVVQPAIDGIGVGWAFTVFGIIIVVATVLPFLEYKLGLRF